MKKNLRQETTSTSPKVIVTGGNGGIGSALAEKLSEDYQVLVLDNRITREFNKNIEAVVCDLTDPEEFKKHLDGVEYIFHLACIKPSERGTTKDEYYENLKMTENIGKYNKDAKVIYSSAGTIYGDQFTFPIKENASITCDISDYYCRGKLESEQILDKYSRENNWPLVNLRITNVYGSEFKRKGEILPEFYIKLINDMPIKIYGDGTQKRDRIFIDDLVNAFYLSIPDRVEGVFNIGSKRSYSTIKVAKIMGKILNKKPELEFERSSGLKRADNLLDIRKARKIMRFKPKVKFSKGVKILLKEWLKSWNT